jgi:hypothetical protein
LILFSNYIVFFFFVSRPKEKLKNKKKGNEEENNDELVPHQPVVHPSIIKEFLLRFPEYGTRLMLLMVQTALKETINWKKRVKILLLTIIFLISIKEYRLWYIE